LLPGLNFLPSLPSFCAAQFISILRFAAADFAAIDAVPANRMSNFSLIFLHNSHIAELARSLN
jgi:hypothetical protein